MKTLADLKRDLKLGTKITKTSHYGKTEGKLIGVERYVVKVKSNSIEFSKNKEDTRGSFLDYPKASLTEYDGETLKVYCSGLRDLTAQEQAILDNVPSRRPENAKQVEIDMLSDGSCMFYADKRYLKEMDSEHLSGHETVRGLRYDWNKKKMLDDNMKGECILTYKIN